MLVLAAMAACSLSRPAVPDTEADLLSDLPPRSVLCEAESYPDPLPAVDEVVDSAMITAAVQQLVADSTARGHVLLSLAFDEEGRSLTRHIVEHTTPPAMADSIRRFAFTARRHPGATKRQWGVRLKVELSPSVPIQVGRREFCPPRPTSLQMEAAMRGYSPPGISSRRGALERTVHMRVFISPEGTVTGALMERGELGGGSLERAIAQHLRQFLFQPATIDGLPAPGSLVIPVRIPVRI